LRQESPEKGGGDVGDNSETLRWNPAGNQSRPAEWPTAGSPRLLCRLLCRLLFSCYSVVIQLLFSCMQQKGGSPMHACITNSLIATRWIRDLLQARPVPGQQPTKKRQKVEPEGCQGREGCQMRSRVAGAGSGEASRLQIIIQKALTSWPARLVSFRPLWGRPRRLPNAFGNLGNQFPIRACHFGSLLASLGINSTCISFCPL
jgi:hypothetical protein